MRHIHTSQLYVAQPMSQAANLRAASTGHVPPLLLAGCKCRDGGDRDGKRVHAERLEQVAGLVVDLDGSIGGCVQGRDLGNVSGRISVRNRAGALGKERGDRECDRERDGKTHWSLRSRSSSCSLKEIPRTGPFWIRFIKWVVTWTDQLMLRDIAYPGRSFNSHPEILFLKRLEGTDATSSSNRLLVL